MEALHENVTANLPSHCKLRPDIWRQPSSDETSTLHSSHSIEAAEPSGPQQASSQALERQAHTYHDATNMSSRTVQDADANVRTASNAQQKSTDVSVAELDWAQDASFLSPPFEVVLIADVVSCCCCCCECHRTRMCLTLLQFPACCLTCAAM